MSRYRRLSLWHDTPGDDPLEPRPRLEEVRSADVVIVGAGYTGLWTAYYLAKLEPQLDVVVVEAEIAGFGASGRNGGWASGELAVNTARAEATHGRPQLVRQFRAIFSSIDEIGRVCVEEGIDADFKKGGTVTFASNPAQVSRLQERLKSEAAWGFGEDDYRWLDAVETARIARSETALGSMYTPHCAALHPFWLARGLAAAAERAGVTIFEGSPVESTGPGLVRTRHGEVRAGTVLRCTEAFSAGLAGGGRRVIPVYSLMIATEPLSTRTWESIGLEERPTFNDARHLVIYGQRTADGRFAFGGRGAPYHFGSAMRPEFEQEPEVHRHIHEVLRRLFPQIGGAAITHTWGGAVAVPRDWTAAVVFDRPSRMGYAGGYVGAGVSASNLAGRTLADLVLERDTVLTSLPWVAHRNRRWEPEPLRYLGVNLGRLLAPMADRVEARSGRPSRLLGGMLRLLTGH
jgi:glycine/D-amino acid oxidase-like deaminating enzyme